VKYKVQIKGIKHLQRKFERFGEEGAKEVAEVTRMNALSIQRDATSNIKKVVNQRTGHLSRSMANEKLDEKGLTYSIYSFANYAAYVEFGTGRMVQVPPEMTEIAMMFKGRGIREVNLPARPFLYPALVKGRPRYIKDLEESLDFLAKKVTK
jgi:HK97 gp10 family phage protein